MAHTRTWLEDLAVKADVEVAVDMIGVKGVL